MKQIERKDSPQRLICELLGRASGMTIAEISAARQLAVLVAEGLLVASGYPRRYRRTQKPLPDIVPRTQRSELETSRRRPARQTPRRTPVPMSTGDLERVFAQWRCAGDSHA